MHDCPIEHCAKRVPSHLLMCGVHWAMVRADLRNAVWRTYRHDGVLSEEYLGARRAAIGYVEERLARMRAYAPPQPR